jgi:peptidoglycan/xylan/chitin deacetylase (PgdA/CDA1 family)
MTPAQSRKRRRRVRATAVGVLLVAGGAAATHAFSGHGGPERSLAAPMPLGRSDRFAGIPIGVLAPARAARLARAARRARAEAETAREERAAERFARSGYPVYCGGLRGKAVALTFDDGPSLSSDRLVALLRRARMQATFFLVGRQVMSFPQQARTEAAAGAVGDHTWNHPHLPRLSSRSVRSELDDTQVAIRRVTGVPVLLFRPPYGLRSPTVERETRRRRMVDVMWTIDGLDWAGLTARQIAARVLGRVRPGSIVLMHETHPQTLRALPSILRRLRRRGLHSVTVPALLAADPPSFRQLRAGIGGCGVRP